MPNVPDHCQRGYIEIDLAAIRANVRSLWQSGHGERQILAVIKSDAYGHGAVATGRALADMEEVYGFAVATAEEAFELREAGIAKPLLVMGHVFPYAYERLIKEQIAVILYREDSLAPLSECCARLGKTLAVHVEVDTGMSRLGIRPDDEGYRFMEKVAACPGIGVDGIYTHFERSDEADGDSTRRQYDDFVAFVGRIETGLGLKIPYRHAAGSAGMLGFAEFGLELARPGIAIYGIWPSDEARERAGGVTLTPALSFYSQIVMIKDCPAGTPVSYGASYVTEKMTKIATVPIGYGDGYPRSLSNSGFVLVRGRRAPIIGRVCMDFFMIDVSDVPAVGVGDRVTLLGADSDERISAEELGRMAGRLHYEVVCAFGQRVPKTKLH